MRIIVEDLTGFEAVLKLQIPTTVKNIKDIIIQEHQYNAKNCLFFHNKKQLQNESIIWINEYEDYSIFMLLNPIEFPNYNFPGNPSRYHFPKSKYFLFFENKKYGMFDKLDSIKSIFRNYYFESYGNEGLEEEEEDVGEISSEVLIQRSGNSTFIRTRVRNSELLSSSFVINLTDEENQIIERLMAIHRNFDRIYIIQVFDACERDEAQTNDCLISMN